MAKSWEQLGKRVMSARKEQGLTQLELAAAMDVERTVVTKIEAGQRTIDSLELARLARVLQRPIAWFVTDPPPSVVSRRADREDVIRREDVALETLAQDVEQLIELGVLEPAPCAAIEIQTLPEAEAAALETRRRAGLGPDEPAWDLVRVVERLGLYVFVLDLVDATSQADGSYVALRQGGVALVGAAHDSGRRRFTIAHELGHHVLADQYASEWIVGGGATEREKVINAFAVHFLLPRAAADRSWSQFKGATEPRDAAIRIAVDFGMSWTAACAQLQRLGCLPGRLYDQVVSARPTRLDFIERELMTRSDVEAPQVPPGYAAAVIRALKKGKLGATRALELLHGTMSDRDLPADRQLPIETMTAELDVLPD
jgi:Zn-dependent peptidase ImmA (M78 family)/DNA-binding XRE family transcriptional regulator